MHEHNDVLLDRTFLTTVLNDLSRRLLRAFGFAIRLVIHGGAVMVLHHQLTCRQNTRDVDYCHRSFVAEQAKRGIPDAGNRLNACIIATAQAYGLGADWMNAHADVALPMAMDPNNGKYVDPIYNDAVHPSNLAMNTVYSSGGLVLIGVTWAWAVALKLVRYQKDDPSDIAAILALGQHSTKGLQWTRQILENWLLKWCSSMGYHSYRPQQLEMTRAKMRDAIRRANDLVSGRSLSPPGMMPAPTAAAVASASKVPVIPWAPQHPPAMPEPYTSDGSRNSRSSLADPLTRLKYPRSHSVARQPLRAIQAPQIVQAVHMPQPSVMPTAPSARSSIASIPSSYHHTRSKSISAARPMSTSVLYPHTATALAPQQVAGLSQIPAGFVPLTFYPHVQNSLPIMIA